MSEMINDFRYPQFSSLMKIDIISINYASAVAKKG